MTGAPSAIPNVLGCKLNQLLKEKITTENSNYPTLYALSYSINNVLGNDSKKRLKAYF